jgi:hypothetical protein
MSDLIDVDDRSRAEGALEEVSAMITQLEKRRDDLQSGLQDSEQGALDLATIATSLEWQKNSFCEWTFLKNRDDSDIAKVRPLAEAILRSKGKRLTLGEFEYFISREKFLNRRPLT